MDAGIIERMRKHHRLADDVPLGVVAVFGKDVEVDTSRGNRDIIVTANTADVDLDSEVVVPSGADTGYFFKNGQIFANHDYGVAVASLRKAFAIPSAADHKAWKVRMRVYSTQLGSDLLTIAREGGIGSSIGFEPTEYGPPTEVEAKQYGGARTIHRRWKWLELSLTSMPCNVACQGGMVGVDETRAADLDRMVTKGLIQRDSAVAFGLPVRPAERRRVLMGLA